MLAGWLPEPVPIPTENDTVDDPTVMRFPVGAGNQVWLGDFYTHQYTPSQPTFTSFVGSPVGGASMLMSF